MTHEPETRTIEARGQRVRMARYSKNLLRGTRHGAKTWTRQSAPESATEMSRACHDVLQVKQARSCLGLFDSSGHGHGQSSVCLFSLTREMIKTKIGRNSDEAVDEATH